MTWKASEDVPLPILRRWSDGERIAALRIFFESIFEVSWRGVREREDKGEGKREKVEGMCVCMCPSLSLSQADAGGLIVLRR